MMNGRMPAFPCAALAAILAIGWIPAVTSAGSTHDSAPVALGNGSANAYLDMDGATPVALGIRITESALEGLPAEPNAQSRCFDINGDGVIQATGECLGDYELELAMPAAINGTDLPFKWIALNWEAHGHNPPGVYDVAHFDFHFYIADRESVRAIRVGSCGVLIDCADFETARMPLHPSHAPDGYIEVGAAVAAMGNHLIDTRSPELANPPVPFTHTFIYGVYGGHITFMEPMVTAEFLRTRPDVCAPIMQPAAWERSGSYPTQYCVRYLPGEGAITVSLEGFVHRDAVATTARTGE